MHLFESKSDALKRKLLRVISATNNIVKLRYIIDERILRDKIDINKIFLDDVLGYNPLQYACAFGAKEAVSTLLMRGKASVKEKTLGGANIVMVACMHALPGESERSKTNSKRNVLEVLTYLLDDINISASADKKGNNALHIILGNAGLFVAAGKVGLLKELVVLLLEHRCRIDALNSKNVKPFDELLRHTSFLGSSQLQDLFHSKQVILAQARAASEMNLAGLSKPAGVLSQQRPSPSESRPTIDLKTYEQLKSIYGLISLKNVDNQPQIIEELNRSSIFDASSVAPKDALHSLLLRAVEEGKGDVVARLLHLQGGAAALQSAAGYSALSIAVIRNRQAMVALLLSYNSLRSYDSLPGTMHPTACIACALGAGRDLLELLIGNSGSAAIAENPLTGWGPARYAESNGETECFQRVETVRKVVEQEASRAAEVAALSAAAQQSSLAERAVAPPSEEAPVVVEESREAALLKIMQEHVMAINGEDDRGAAGNSVPYSQLTANNSLGIEQLAKEKVEAERLVSERERAEAERLASERERVDSNPERVSNFEARRRSIFVDKIPAHVARSGEPRQLSAARPSPVLAPPPPEQPYSALPTLLASFNSRIVRIGLSNTAFVVTTTGGQTIVSIAYANIQTVDCDEGDSGLFRLFVDNLHTNLSTAPPIKDYRGYLIFKAVDSMACGDFVRHIVSAKLRFSLTNF